MPHSDTIYDSITIWNLAHELAYWTCAQIVYDRILRIFLLLAILNIGLLQFKEGEMGGYVTRIGGNEECARNFGWKAWREGSTQKT
jgi:ribose/xylose/arabinose/galactoside ABC-type transport system permease subunit